MDADATGPKVSPADVAGHLKVANVTWICHSWVQVFLSDGGNWHVIHVLIKVLEGFMGRSINIWR